MEVRGAWWLGKHALWNHAVRCKSSPAQTGDTAALVLWRCRAWERLRLHQNKAPEIGPITLELGLRPAESLTKPAAYPERGIYAVPQSHETGAGSKVFI